MPSNSIQAEMGKETLSRRTMLMTETLIVGDLPAAMQLLKRHLACHQAIQTSCIAGDNLCGYCRLA